MLIKVATAHRGKGAAKNRRITATTSTVSISLFTVCNYGEICKEIANSALGSFFAVLTEIGLRKVPLNFSAIAEALRRLHTL